MRVEPEGVIFHNDQTFTLLDKLKEAVIEYVIFYNDYSPHETLSNSTPNNYEENFYISTMNKGFKTVRKVSIGTKSLF